MADIAPDALRVAAHDVPVPRSLSEGARRALDASAQVPRTILPRADDDDAWEGVVAGQRAQEEQLIASGLLETYIASTRTQVDARLVDGVPVFVGTPDGLADDDQRVVLVIHGGGWTQGGGQLTRLAAALEASSLGLRTWAVDYRMLPGHRYPASLDDCVAVYRSLIGEAGAANVAVSGTSAGGNLAAALLLRAAADGLPMPAALGLWTPAVDLTLDGDSWHTNDGLDPIIGQHSRTLVEFYTRGEDPRNPSLSPIFGDLSPFPPTVLISGTRDGLLSDTVRFHRQLRRSGVEAELHVFEGLPHGGFDFMSPEDAERATEFRAFFRRHLA
ncbi:alpha/beta hydrolase fold domain-containing protein [Leifsonia poae]|uniref:alpha/beta hydrolase fold domain-containing protein n=1 Tax=Leifsonia poae TaxID=110933 RepID=UPI001CBF70BC|nr:alpha/beta hydrolase [Leifsonia poae]